jgi:hypothetical protein
MIYAPQLQMVQASCYLNWEPNQLDTAYDVKYLTMTFYLKKIFYNDLMKEQIKQVEEDICLVQQTKSFFPEHQEVHIMPALSEQSKSNSISFTDSQPKFNPQNISHPIKDDQENEEEEDDEEGDDEEAQDDSEEENVPLNISQIDPTANFGTAEPSELMQLEMSEGIRLGSPDDCSNNFEAELQMLGMCHDTTDQVIPRQDDTYQGWHFLNEDLSAGFPRTSGSS